MGIIVFFAFAIIEVITRLACGGLANAGITALSICAVRNGAGLAWIAMLAAVVIVVLLANRVMNVKSGDTGFRFANTGVTNHRAGILNIAGMTACAAMVRAG